MAKTSKSFRLSEQALEHLERVVKLTGTNETAIIELALAHLSVRLSETDAALVQPGTPSIKQEKPVQQNSGGGRKRHKSKGR